MKGLLRHSSQYNYDTKDNNTMNTLEQYITDDLLNEYANTRDKAILLADTLEVSISSSKWEALEQLVIDSCDTKGITINWFE
jgi:hypothetical protein